MFVCLFVCGETIGARRKETFNVYDMSRLLKMFTRVDFGTYEIMETYGIGARAVLVEEKTFAYSAFVKLPKSAV